MDNTDNTFSIKADLTANIYKEESGLFVSHCPTLDLYSQGQTSEQAEKSIIAVTSTFIRSCLEHNTLNKVLEENGFRSVDAKPTNKKAERQSTLSAATKLRTIKFLAELPVMVI